MAASSDILVTHHHADHTAGIEELKKKYLCRVIAPRKEAAKIPRKVDVTVREGDIVQRRLAGRARARNAGHTLGHVSYWFKQDKIAFVGDTLFSVGCGRILEGNPEMMWNSLLKIRNLPADTQLYCGHEYTASNVHFALTIETEQRVARARRGSGAPHRAEDARRSRPRCSRRNRFNPFLRADLHSVAVERSGLEGAGAVKVFADDPRAQG